MTQRSRITRLRLCLPPSPPLLPIGCYPYNLLVYRNISIRTSSTYKMGLSNLKLEVWPTFSWRKTEFNSIRTPRGLTLLFVEALELASLRSSMPSVARAWSCPHHSISLLPRRVTIQVSFLVSLSVMQTLMKGSLVITTDACCWCCWPWYYYCQVSYIHLFAIWLCRLSSFLESG
jgi:hypothetical protein